MHSRSTRDARQSTTITNEETFNRSRRLERLSRKTRQLHAYLAASADRVTAALDQLTIDCRDAAGDGLNRLEDGVQDGLFQVVRIEVRHIDVLRTRNQTYAYKLKSKSLYLPIEMSLASQTCAYVAIEFTTAKGSLT